MLSDLLKGIDLLIGALRGMPLQKKRSLAKELKQLYLNLDRIVELGEQLSAALDKKVSLSEQSLLQILSAKQDAIEEVLKCLRSDHIASILKIHVPTFRGIHAALGAKHCGIGFLLGQLIAPASEESGTIKVRQRGYEWDFHSQWPNELEGALQDPSRTEDDIQTESLDWYTHYGEEPILKLEGQFGRIDRSGYGGHVFASKKQRHEFKEVIDELKKCAEALRKLLADQFALEDFL